MRNTPWLAGLYAHGVRGRIAQGAEHRETQPNLGWQWRIPRAGTIRAALRQCRWVQRSCECQLTGPSASKAGKFVPLYVETSTGCRALGASCIRPPRVSDENALAQRHDARDHERW